MPIDRPSTRGYVLLPLAAPHHRREGLVFCGPSDKGKQYTGPPPAAVEATTRMTYEQSRRARPAQARIWGDCGSASSLLDRQFRASTTTSCVGTGRSRVAATSISGLSLGEAKRSSHRSRHTRCSNSSNPEAAACLQECSGPSGELAPGRATADFRSASPRSSATSTTRDQCGKSSTAVVYSAARHALVPAAKAAVVRCALQGIPQCPVAWKPVAMAASSTVAIARPAVDGAPGDLALIRRSGAIVFACLAGASGERRGARFD